MYEVSDKFLTAIKSNTRNYYWTGKITTVSGTEYVFSYENIVKGSGSITQQCCGSTEMEIGSVYASELSISLFLDVNKNSMDGAKVELWYSLRVASGKYEKIPMGVFEVSEANRTTHILEIKAYDYMLWFEEKFSNYESVGTCYDFMALCGKACGVKLEQTKEYIQSLENGKTIISICEDNDIETYRDVLYYIGQILGGFFFINRNGKLELKRYGATPVLEIGQKNRFSSSVSDFVTRYTAVSSTNSVTETSEYYHLEKDDALTMNLGINPFLQYGTEDSRKNLCTNILNAIAVINYSPFDMETTGNPALDIGDVIQITGGQMGIDGELGCITSRTIRIGGREKLAGVGKKPKYSSAKSKNDKNLIGILNKVDVNTFQTILFSNAQELNINAGKRNQVENMTFAVKRISAVEFQGQIIVEVTADENEDKESYVICKVIFIFDKEEITLHRPIETLVNGKHILSLFYPLEEISPNIVHEFKVCIEVESGSAKIEVGGAIGCIRGNGVINADINWDGTLVFEEEIGNKLLNGIFGVETMKDEIGVVTQIPRNAVIKESVTLISFNSERMLDID